MSYDITLVRRRPGQSWDDAFAAARRDADAPLGAERLAVWPRIELRVAEILGEGTESAVDATAAELTHLPTGVQVSLPASDHRRAMRYLITGVVILALAVPLLFLNPDPSFFGYFAVTIGAVDTVVSLVLWRRARR